MPIVIPEPEHRSRVPPRRLRRARKSTHQPSWSQSDDSDGNENTDISQLYTTSVAKDRTKQKASKSAKRSPSPTERQSNHKHTHHQPTALARTAWQSVRVDLPIGDVPRRFMRTIKALLLMFQVVNTVLLSGMAYMYLTLHVRNSFLWFLRYNFLFATARLYLDGASEWMGVCYAVLAACFAYLSVSMLFMSRGALLQATTTALTITTHRPAQHRGSTYLAPFQAVTKAVLFLWNSSGIRSKYFPYTLVVREAIELVLQTIQAYNASCCISNLVVNQLYGVIILLNSLSTTVVHSWYSHDILKARFTNVLVDLTLDFCWGTLLPLWNVSTYVRVYLSRDRLSDVLEFPENAAREVAQIVVMSRMQFLLSVYPFISTFLGLIELKHVLSHGGHVSIGDQRRALNLNAVTTSERKCDSDAKDEDDRSSRGSSCAPTAVATKQSTANEVVTTSNTLIAVTHAHSAPVLGCITLRSVHWLLISYGVVVFIISLYGSGVFFIRRERAPFACAHRVYPWFSRKEACVGRIINCGSDGLVNGGNATEVSTALALFDEATLTDLVFSNCSNLVITSALHQFPGLTTVVVEHSVLQSWDTSANVTVETLPVIQTVKLLQSKLLAQPTALIAAKLPPSLKWISIANTDVHELLDLVGPLWSTLKYFYCDGCALTHVPGALASMTQLQELTLANNSITHVVSSDFASMLELTQFRIDGNPVANLPDSLWEHCRWVADFFIQSTTIGSLPTWLDNVDNEILRVYGFNTTLCAAETLKVRPAALSCTYSDGKA